jgi:DNA-directed RNA polymerase subunit RPC12/RpoP
VSHRDANHASITHICLGANVDAPMLRADTDKPHRCPECGSVASYGDRFPWKQQDGTRIRWWRSYRCACCGQRFARWRWLPEASPETTAPERS